MAIRHRNVTCNEFLCLPENNPSHYESDEADNQGYRRRRADSLITDLWPLILERLRAMADPQARTLAEGAVAQKGLDEVSLLALTDWLKENQFDGIAQEVARLPLTGGALVILRAPAVLDRRQALDIRQALEKDHQGVRFLVVSEGWDVAAVNWLVRNG